jgi:RNA polymerase sigma-70 factor (ECF subfamily)
MDAAIAHGAGEQDAIPVNPGDQLALRRLIEAHARPLYQLCFRITRDAALAEDAVQEAFFRAWRALDQFQERAALLTWLRRIAVNAALEQLRRNARHRQHMVASEASVDSDSEGDFLAELPDEAPGPEAQVNGTQLGERISEYMDQLSATERAAFVMRHCEGEQLENIAAALSMNTGQCKQAIFRAVRKLRAALAILR